MSAVPIKFYAPVVYDAKSHDFGWKDRLIHEWREHADDRTTAVLASSIEHAREAVSVFNRECIHAGLVYGDMRNSDRLTTFEKLRSKRTLVLCMAHQFPELETCGVGCLVLAHRTISRLLYHKAVDLVRHYDDEVPGIVIDLFGCVSKYGMPEGVAEIQNESTP